MSMKPINLNAFLMQKIMKALAFGNWDEVFNFYKFMPISIIVDSIRDVLANVDVITDSELTSVARAIHRQNYDDSNDSCVSERHLLTIKSNSTDCRMNNALYERIKTTVQDFYGDYSIDVSITKESISQSLTISNSTTGNISQSK